MRVLAAHAIAGLLALPAVADQDDPRLDELFAVLQTTDDDATASAATNMIWAIWTYSEDDDVRRLMASGIQAMRIRAYPDALRYFDRIIEVAPAFAEGWNKRATVFYLMGDFEKSIDDVDVTLALEPRHFGALSGLGQICMAMGEEEEALTAFEEALEVHPHLVGARATVSVLREKLRGEPL